MAFKVGIIGTGKMSERMADTIVRMPEAELYAVASRTEEKAEAFGKKYHAVKCYGSYDALMEDAEVQLIYIAIPNHLHYEVARACIQHGKPILLEKPFTLNEQQAQALIDLAEMHQIFLCEAMWTRFMPLNLRLQKELQNGRIGEITAVTANLGYDIKEKERVSRLDMGGGALLDIGVYPITFALQMLGNELDNLSTSMVRLNSGVDAQECINLTYANGAMAGLYTTILSETDKQGKIYGTEGYIIVDNINNPESYHIYDKTGNLLETAERPEQLSGLEYEVQACIHAIQGKKPECPQVTHMDTLLLMRILDTIRRSWDMRFPQEEQIR